MCSISAPTSAGTSYFFARKRIASDAEGVSAPRNPPGTNDGRASACAALLARRRSKSQTRPTRSIRSPTSTQWSISAPLSRGKSGAPRPMRSACFAISNEPITTSAPSTRSGTLAFFDRAFRRRSTSPSIGTCSWKVNATPW